MLLITLLLLLKFINCSKGVPVLDNDQKLMKSLESTKIAAASSTQGPVFDQKMYEADYTIDHKLELQKILKLQHGDQSNITLILTGYNEFFNIRFAKPSSGEISVELIKPLSEKTLSSQKSIQLSIKAVVKEDISKFDVCILRVNIFTLPTTALPKPTLTPSENAMPGPVFSQKVYQANYTIDHKLELKEVITLHNGNSSNITLTITGYNNFFNISFAKSTPGKIVVELTQPLSEKIISSQKSIQLNIQAELKKAPTKLASCTLLINIFTGLDTHPTTESVVDPTTNSLESPEENATQGPVFDKKAYEANYTIDHKLELKQSITLHNGDSSNTTLTLIGYNKFFNVSFAKTSGEIVVELTHHLSKNIISSQKSIQLSVQAELKKVPKKYATCTLVIHIFTALTTEATTEFLTNSTATTPPTHIITEFPTKPIISYTTKSKDLTTERISIATIKASEPLKGNASVLSAKNTNESEDTMKTGVTAIFDINHRYSYYTSVAIILAIQTVLTLFCIVLFVLHIKRYLVAPANDKV